MHHKKAKITPSLDLSHNISFGSFLQGKAMDFDWQHLTSVQCPSFDVLVCTLLSACVV